MQADRWVVLGADGMLGQAWQKDSELSGARCLGRSQCDVRREDHVETAITQETEVVVNCAAWTDVDGAESQEPAATAVNGEGAGRVAARCREIGALLVHFSTDYVFQGNAEQPYLETSPIDPLNAYGRSKAVGESLIQASGCDYLILRTSWVYAAWGQNFVRSIAAACRKRDTLRVVNDQRGRPTCAVQLAASSRALIEAGARGIYHVTDGGEPCTWFDFAAAIVSRVRPECEVLPCQSHEYPRPAPRPAYSVLDLAKVEHLLGPRRPWRTSLDRVLTSLSVPGSAG